MRRISLPTTLALFALLIGSHSLATLTDSQAKIVRNAVDRLNMGKLNSTSVQPLLTDIGKHCSKVDIQLEPPTCTERFEIAMDCVRLPEGMGNCSKQIYSLRLAGLAMLTKDTAPTKTEPIAVKKTKSDVVLGRSRSGYTPPSKPASMPEQRSRAGAMTTKTPAETLEE